LILLVVGAAGARAVATPNTAGFDMPLAAKVFSAALAFAAPRVLDPATPQSLTLWGLQGITALDPSLSANLIGGKLQLSLGKHVLFMQPAPMASDAPAWGRMAADVWRVAYGQSANLRAVGTQGVIAGFFDEMFNHLDPYSRYEPPEPAEAERTKLSVDAGAGIGLTSNPHAVIVDDVVPDGPAQQAGIRVGDSIISVDGRHVRGRLELTKSLLSGPEGTAITLRVRGLDGLVRDIPLSLAYVPPETVFPERVGAIMVIHITSFVNNTAERLSEAIEAGLAAKPAPSAMVIDLRGNRGGLLRQAVTAVALLADHGVIASTAGRDPEATHDWRIDGGDLTHGLPVIVLVDGSTASAAEIMAAALADLGRGGRQCDAGQGVSADHHPAARWRRAVRHLEPRAGAARLAPAIAGRHTADMHQPWGCYGQESAAGSRRWPGRHGDGPYTLPRCPPAAAGGAGAGYPCRLPG
jgi:carboxyl-terminal processing protease